MSDNYTFQQERKPVNYSSVSTISASGSKMYFIELKNHLQELLCRQNLR